MATESPTRNNAYALLDILRETPTDPDCLSRVEQLLRVVETRAYVIEYLGELMSSPALRQCERNAALMLAHLTDHEGSYRASFGELDITPDLTNQIMLQGFDVIRTATAVETPLHAQLLLIEDQDGHKALLVSVDLFGVGQTIVNYVRQAAREWGIPPEAVILNASHTHYAPGTVEHVSECIGPFNAHYSSNVAAAIARSIGQLFTDLEPCFVFAGTTDAKIGENRCLPVDDRTLLRPNPDGYYHQNTPVLTISFLHSGSSVVIVNHGCHPTGLGPAEVVSAEYPGYLRRSLMEHGAADGVMVLQGAAGTAKETTNDDGAPKFARSTEVVVENALVLSQAVIQTICEPMAPISGPIFARRKTLRLPYSSVPSSEVYGALKEDKSQPPLVRIWAETQLGPPASDDATILESEIQLLALGDEICFLTIAGEPAAELARAILDRSGLPENTLFLGYTNGLDAYFLTADMLARDSYESTTSITVYNLTYKLDPCTEAVFIDAAADLVRAWRTTDEPNGFGRYHLAESQGDAFFCLSTGRCGTQTLKHILDTSSNARVYHHPRPFLINETLSAYHGELDTKAGFWYARGDVIRDAWKDGLVFGELDHNMTPFAPAIADGIDNSKFIVLVRNPWDFVRSGMRRGYYRGHSWDSGRLRPEATHPDAARWDRMEPFEKVCWLWNETYRRIATFVETLSEDRYRIVYFEQLVAGIDEGSDLFEFLGLDGFDAERVHHVLGQKLNAQTGGEYPRPEEWTARQHDIVRRTCRPAIDALGLKEYERTYLGAEPAPVAGKISQSSNDEAPAESRVVATTIWDYTRFKNRAYPAQISPVGITEHNPRPSWIDRTTPITSMGSCFARNVAKYLMRRGYRYIVSEEPFQQASAHWDQVFNTASMRQIFEYSLSDEWQPLVRWWPKGDHVQDPFRRHIIYPAVTCEQAFQRHREASRSALTEARAVILTLGLIETWRDRRDKMTYYRVPSPDVYDEELHEFYVQSVEDCLADLNLIQALLNEHNPEANIIVTVSPVPLFATFRMDTDAVSANRLSKSTLRVAAEYFAQAHPNVHYFPSYEIVTQGIANPWEKDNRHVKQDAVDTVMEAFEALFMREPTGQLSAHARVAAS